MVCRHFLEDVFNAVPNGMLAVDRFGRITSINRKALVILRLNKEVVMQQPIDHVSPHLAALVTGFLDDGRPRHGQQVVENQDGLMVEMCPDWMFKIIPLARYAVLFASGILNHRPAT